MVTDLVKLLMPNICLFFAIIAQTVFGLLKSPKLAFRYKNVNIITSNIVSCIGILLSIIFQLQVPKDYLGFDNSILSSAVSNCLSVLVLFCGLATILLAGPLLRDNRQSCYKFHILLLTALIGALFTMCANDFLTLFVSLETLSFSLYFLIAFSRGYVSKEASFKYLLINAVSVMFFLFGVSYLLGITSSLNFSEISQILTGEHNSIIYTISGVMIVVGLVMKLAIFPFANWVLDVYTGSDTAILAFLSTVPKVAVLGVLFRLLGTVLSYSFELNVIILLLAILTAFWANIYAIKENNIKRLLACSTSANSAYMLIVLAIVSQFNSAAVLFYLVCYVVMNIGVFAYLNLLEPTTKNFLLEELPRVKNIGYVFAFLICLFGLAGLPITSGFVAKVYLLYALIESGLLLLPIAFLLLILFALALYYYIKIARSVATNREVIVSSKGSSLILVISALVTFLLGVIPFSLIIYCVNVFA